jgi:hypothetical protein
MAKSADYDRPKLTTTERNDPGVRKAARKVTTAKRMMATARRTSSKQPIPSRGAGQRRDGSRGSELVTQIDNAGSELKKAKTKANVRASSKRVAKKLTTKKK